MGHPDATDLIDEVAQPDMFRDEDLAYALRLGQAGKHSAGRLWMPAQAAR